MNYDLKTYILIFFTYSIAGWCMEVIRMFFNPKYKKFVNRGFLIGPYLPIYGWGVVGITLFLGKYSNDIAALFFLSIIVCGILEYMTSFIMEKLFNARWWDYSTRKFNINGRVCLETLIPFGIGGTLILHWINPFIVNLYDKIPNTPKAIIAYSLVALMAIDTIISFTIISKFKSSANEVDLSEADDTENISKYVRDKAEDKAMELESSIRKETRKRKLKMQRSALHLKLRAHKEIARAKLGSKELQTKITSGINEKIESAKLTSKEFSEQVKAKFAKRNILTKRLMEAFPNVELINIKDKIKDRLNK